MATGVIACIITVFWDNDQWDLTYCWFINKHLSLFFCGIVHGSLPKVQD